MNIMFGLDFRGWLLSTTYYYQPRHLMMISIPASAMRQIKAGTFNTAVPYNG